MDLDPFNRQGPLRTQMVATGLIGLKHAPSVHLFCTTALKQTLATTLGCFKRGRSETKKHRRISPRRNEVRPLSGVSRKEGVGPPIHHSKGGNVHTAGTVVFTLKSPGNGFPRAIQSGPRYGRCCSDSPMTAPSPGGFREAVNGNVGPDRIKVHRRWGWLVKPNHPGTGRKLISV